MRKNKIYKEIKPGRKLFKVVTVKVILFFLGRGFQFLSKFDKNIKNDIYGFSEGFTVMFKVLPIGSKMFLKKNKKGYLKYKGSSLNEKESDLSIFFKNIECAFLMFTAQISSHQAFAEHRISIKGDIPKAMLLMRCLNVVETYLFPKIIAKHITKRLPRISGIKKQIGRFLVYFWGIPFGI